MWNNLWREHRGKSIGLIIGILLGFIYLFSGFWNTLMFALIVWASFYIGKQSDRQKRIAPWNEIFQWLSSRWDRFK